MCHPAKLAGHFAVRSTFVVLTVLCVAVTPFVLFLCRQSAGEGRVTRVIRFLREEKTS